MILRMPTAATAWMIDEGFCFQKSENRAWQSWR